LGRVVQAGRSVWRGRSAMSSARLSRGSPNLNLKYPALFISPFVLYAGHQALSNKAGAEEKEATQIIEEELSLEVQRTYQHNSSRTSSGAFMGKSSKCECHQKELDSTCQNEHLENIRLVESSLFQEASNSVPPANLPSANLEHVQTSEGLLAAETERTYSQSSTQHMQSEHAQTSTEQPTSQEVPFAPLLEQSVNEFDIFQKWKNYIDEITRDQMKSLEESYDKKLQEQKDILERRFGEELLLQKEQLESKFRVKYRQEVLQIRSKFAADMEQFKSREKEKYQKKILQLENDYLSQLEAEKAKLKANLNNIHDEFKKKLTELQSAISKEHSVRLEKVKHLLDSSQHQQLAQFALLEHVNEQEQNLSLALAALSTLRQANCGVAFDRSLEQLKQFGSSDPVLQAVVNLVPPSVAKAGVPTLPKLQVQFVHTVEQAFLDSLMGQSPSIFSYLGSRVFYRFLNRKRGLVDGITPEDRLARAEYYINAGDLEATINEVQAIDGPAAVTLTAWLTAAKERQSVLLVLDLIESHIRTSLSSALQ